MPLLIGTDKFRINIMKWVSFILAFILLYATLFQGMNYNLILGMKIADIIPVGFIFGIIYGYAFYLYHVKGLL